MINNKNEILQTIIDGFLEDSLELKIKFQNNLMRIKEMDVFLNAIHMDQESDFNVFSPRKKEFYNDKNKVEERRREKGELESENQKIEQKINQLEKRISDLQEIVTDKQLEDNILKTEKDSLMCLGIQEKERQRIARDLHDFSLQNLTHLIHILELSSLYIDQDPSRTKLELAAAGKKIKAIIEDIRNTIYDLRPMEFDDLGFKDAIQNMVYKLKNETDIFIDLEMEKDIPIKNELIFSNIYRIIKEGVANAIKHSEAKEIKITIFEDNNKCHIEIRDNGKGFDNLSVKEKKKHFGLKILEERIQMLRGTLDIQSTYCESFSKLEKKGTIISIDIPIDDKEAGGTI